MGVVVERNFGPLDEIELLTVEDMREIGLLVREQIITRTLGGQDAQGQSFAPYSKAYAQRKQAELGTSDVNLQVSGNMLNHIQIVAVDENSVTLGWEQ